MRALTTAQTKTLAASGYAVHVRAMVDDGTGTFRDLSSLAGHNFVQEASISESVDQGVATAELSLKREVHELRLSPFVEASKLNRLTGSYVPLVQIGRRIKLETATVPSDRAPVSADWVLAFDGYMDDVDPADDLVRVTCRDLGARLQDTIIETERVYGIGLTAGLLPWKASTAYSVGHKVLMVNKDGPYGTGYWTCTTAGTTGAKPPLWNLVGTTTDGTVVWTYAGTYNTAGGAVQTQMQAILDDTLGAGVVQLYTPVAPGWNITWFAQRREPVMEALRNLAQQIGWDVRYRWHSGTSQFRLTFFEPERSKSTPDRTFAPSQYYRIGSLRVSRSGIRNVVRVSYPDAADLMENGQPRQKSVVVQDSASIAAYGRRYMEITEASSSQIDSGTEATMMANAILSDLKQPTAEQQVELDYFFAAELGDLYRWTANGVHSDADMDLAVVAIQHTLRGDSPRTTLTCRGKPSGGYKRWHELDARPGVAAPGQDAAPEGTGQISMVTTIGGLVVQFEKPWKRGRFRHAELHVSGAPGFTPSTATLAGVTDTSRFDLTGLAPGVEKHVRLLIRDDRGNAAMSDEYAATPRFVELTDVDPLLTAGSKATLVEDVLHDDNTEFLIPVDGVVFDDLNLVSTTHGWWECPATGKWAVTAQITARGPGSGQARAQLLVNSSVAAEGPLSPVMRRPTDGEYVATPAISEILPLNQGDLLQLQLAKLGDFSAAVIEPAGTYLQVVRALIP